MRIRRILFHRKWFEESCGLEKWSIFRYGQSTPPTAFRSTTERDPRVVTLRLVVVRRGQNYFESWDKCGRLASSVFPLVRLLLELVELLKNTQRFEKGAIKHQKHHF